MRLNRVLSALVLTGLLSGAGMAAQAQTRFAFRIATPAATVVAGYAPQYQGPRLVWISGYFNGGRWIPGYWAHRMDSRYRMQDRYYGRYMRRNDFGRNFRSNRDDHQWNRNRRDHRNRDRYNNNGRYNNHGRHNGYGHSQWNRRGGRH